MCYRTFDRYHTNGYYPADREIWSREDLGNAQRCLWIAAMTARLKSGRVMAILSLSVVSLRSLLLALMFPSTLTTYGQVSCPSADVSNILVAPLQV